MRDVHRPFHVVAPQITEFVNGYIDEHGYSPTVREVGDHVDLTVSAIHRVLRLMSEQGLVTWAPGMPRTLRTVAGASMRAPEIHV